MITTNTIPAHAAMVATVAAICLAVAACGGQQGTTPDRESHHTAQHAVANDVAAQVDHRKAALSQAMGRSRYAAPNDVAAQVDHRKAALSQLRGRPLQTAADDVAARVDHRKSARAESGGPLTHSR